MTFVRNRLYDLNFLKERKFDTHTIGVGNLSVGGAGKTPLVEYLIRLLEKQSYTLATLSRGYKRKTKGFILADDESTANDIGDEPLLYKQKYKVQVAVDANRVNGIEKLMSLGKDAPKVILLDDVFQHRSVRCGLTILVSDYNNLYFNDYLMPFGRLRESKNGASRADIIIISKTPERTSAVEIRTIVKDIHPLAHQKVFFSYISYGDLYAIDQAPKKLDTLNELFQYCVICFTGIANAAPMINYLKEYAGDVKHLPFDDHHEFVMNDLIDIERYYQSFSGVNKILVTTEKDLMRLKDESIWDFAKTLNIYILPIEITFKDKEEEFNQTILNYVRTNRIHHQKYS
ncbi:MAG: tetraacyldisaccharide 4'-kinase [Bacteroidota bacterium]